MPVLAIYIGTSSISGVIYESSDKYRFISYPYVYSDELFSGYVSEGEYYKSFITNICAEYKLKLTDVEIVVGTFLKKIDVGFEVKKSFNLPEILNGVSTSRFPVVVNSYSVVTPNNFISYLVLNDETSVQPDAALSEDEKNFYHNTSVYNSVVHFDMTTLVDHDRNILAKLATNELIYNNNLPLTFMGSRFAAPYGFYNTEIDYILILNLIKKAGIFEVELDRERYLILQYILKAYDKSAQLMAEGKVEKLGTLINTYGEAECLITSEIGTSQLLDIEKDKVFVLPLNYNERAHLTIKSQKIGTMEKDVTGGKLGLIFDTRVEKVDITSDLKVFNASLKSLGQALSKI